MNGHVDDKLRALIPVQVVVNDSEYPLLGTMLLAGHRLEIDYDERTVTLR